MINVKIYWVDNLTERSLEGAIKTLPSLGQALVVTDKNNSKLEIDFGKVLNLKNSDRVLLVRTTEGVYEVHFLPNLDGRPLANVIHFGKSNPVKLQKKIDNFIHLMKEYRSLEKERYNKEVENYRKKVIKIVSNSSKPTELPAF